MSQTTRPLTVPTFATDATYPGGGANKVSPPAGILAQGFAVDQPLPAEYFNDRLNLIGQWLEFLSDIQLLNWFRSTANSTYSSNVCVFDDSNGKWIVGSTAGHYAVATADAAVLGTWTTGTLSPAADVKGGASFGGTTVLVGATKAWYSTDGGANWTGGAIGADAPNAVGVCWDAGNSRFAACCHESAYPRIYTFDPVGHTWTLRAAAHGGTAIAYASGKLVTVGLAGAISYSTDGGVTWNAITPLTSADLMSVAYDPVRATWIASGASGAYLTSPDGIVWTLHNHSAVDLLKVRTSGGTWIFLLGTGATNATQIAYSNNGGTTWKDVLLVGAVVQGAGLAVGGGRIMVGCSDGNVAYSIRVGL